jgi:hypothetical protein
MKTRFLFLLSVAVLTSLPTPALACTVCMGDSNSQWAGAVNGMVFLMLGFIGSMMIATGAVAYYLYKRAKTPIPPHIQLVESMSADAASK